MTDEGNQRLMEQNTTTMETAGPLELPPRILALLSAIANQCGISEQALVLLLLNQLLLAESDLFKGRVREAYDELGKAG